MTITEDIVESFCQGLGGSRFRHLFDILEEYGLRPLGKSNTATLLYQRIGPGGSTEDIFAFRKSSPHVISFPKSYWTSRSRALGDILDQFQYSEKPAIEGPISESQYSAGQIELSRNTEERIVKMCERICSEFDTD